MCELWSFSLPVRTGVKLSSIANKLKWHCHRGCESEAQQPRAWSCEEDRYVVVFPGRSSRSEYLLNSMIYENVNGLKGDKRTPQQQQKRQAVFLFSLLFWLRSGIRKLGTDGESNGMMAFGRLLKQHYVWNLSGYSFKLK